MDIDGERKTRVQGIKRRWVYNYIIITLAILLIIEAGFMIAVRNYYYTNVSTLISYRANHATDFYNSYISNENYDIEEISERMLKDFSTTSDENLEFQILDTSGNVVVSSSGFHVDYSIETEDVIQALKGNTYTWYGENKDTEELIMAASSALKNSSGEVIGVLRYVTSLSEVTDAIVRTFVSSMFLMVIIILIMLMLSVFFNKSILNPINEINEVAKKMAEGQFSERIEKHYNDEIGELADTLNYMAGEITKTTELKNEFISSISHELRTPLTSIRGWSETIVSGDLEDKEEAKIGLNIIVKETTRLSHMVEELLDFSKMESGRIVLHLEPVNIGEELEEIYNITKLRAKKDKVNLIYTSPGRGTLPEIVADRNRLKQVFINVIDNAIKFTPEDKNVYIEPSFDDENLKITIRDEGIGIPEEDIDHIHEKFYKGKSKKSGSGIGLAISNEIIKLHKGEFSVESIEGKGTSVNIILPLDRDRIV